jgi:hypothetical protein
MLPEYPHDPRRVVPPPPEDSPFVLGERIRQIDGGSLYYYVPGFYGREREFESIEGECALPPAVADVAELQKAAVLEIKEKKEAESRVQEAEAGMQTADFTFNKGGPRALDVETTEAQAALEALLRSDG